MLFALEGPDGCGKTTLFQALRQHRALSHCRFVPSVPVPPELRAVMPWAGMRHLQLWEALYDPAETYVCDRFAAVSGPVYDALKVKPTVMDWKRWSTRVHVLYVHVPVEELIKRFRARGDDFVGEHELVRCCELYSVVLNEFRVTVLDGMQPVEALVRRVLECVK